MTDTDRRLGIQVVHRRYIGHHQAHYGGGLVDGAFVLGLFGDAATELCIRTDGDEGLFASYAEINFLAPVLAGDVVEVLATVKRVGRRSRDLDLECRIVCRADPGLSPSASRVLDPPLVAVRATGTVVVPDTNS